MKTQIFHHAKNKIFKKISSKRNQNPSRYYNSITNLKISSTPAKISSFKNPQIKIDLLLLLLPSRGQNPLSYYTLVMNLNTIILLALVGKATNKEENGKRVTRWVAVLCEFVFLEQLSFTSGKENILEEIKSRKNEFLVQNS